MQLLQVFQFLIKRKIFFTLILIASLDPVPIYFFVYTDIEHINGWFTCIYI